MRRRRRLLGLTQQQLAEACGVRFQQIQKYECGANRVSAARLWRISSALEVPVNYFFEGLDDEITVVPVQPATSPPTWCGRITRWGSVRAAACSIWPATSTATPTRPDAAPQNGVGATALPAEPSDVYGSACFPTRAWPNSTASSSS